MQRLFGIITEDLVAADMKLAEQKWQFLKQVVSVGGLLCLCVQCLPFRTSLIVQKT